MATPSLVSPLQQIHRGTVAVVIELDREGKNIVVTPDSFWVSKSAKQGVEWFCSIGHVHEENNEPCFKVNFNGPNGSPFDNAHFEHNHVTSGWVKDQITPGETLYKYTVTVGTLTKDPTGGVEP